MSGHSKWHSIKHAKGAADAARGKAFARLARQIEVAARDGGGDIEGNPTLRTMVQKARDASMPKDNIERAIKRGTGELEGVTYESITYEGYATNGVAVYVEALTDNRNRTGAEVKNVFTRNGGLARRARRGGVAVRAQGRDHPRQVGGVGGRPHARRARRRRRGHRPTSGDTWQVTTRRPTSTQCAPRSRRPGSRSPAPTSPCCRRPAVELSDDGEQGEVGAAGDRRARGARRRPERLRQLRHPRRRPAIGIRYGPRRRARASSASTTRRSCSRTGPTGGRRCPRSRAASTPTVSRGQHAGDRAEDQERRRDPRVSLCVLTRRVLRRLDPGRRHRQVVSLPDAMEPLVEYYRSIRGEHPDWDEYRAAMVRERRVIVGSRSTRAGPDRSG